MLACFLFICAFSILALSIAFSPSIKNAINIVWAVGFESFCGFAEVILSIQCYLMVGSLIAKKHQAKAMGIACCIYGISSWFSYGISSLFFHKQTVFDIKAYDHNMLGLSLLMIISLGFIFLALKYPYFVKNNKAFKLNLNKKLHGSLVTY